MLCQIELLIKVIGAGRISGSLTCVQTNSYFCCRNWQFTVLTRIQSCNSFFPGRKCTLVPYGCMNLSARNIRNTVRNTAHRSDISNYTACFYWSVHHQHVVAWQVWLNYKRFSQMRPLVLMLNFYLHMMEKHRTSIWRWKDSFFFAEADQHKNVGGNSQGNCEKLTNKPQYAPQQVMHARQVWVGFLRTP